MVTDLERAISALSLEFDLIPASVARDVIVEARSSGRPVVDVLREQVAEEDLLKAIASALGARFYNLFSTSQDYRLDESVLRRADLNVLKQYSALPLVDRDSRVVVALANPGAEINDYIKARFPEGVRFVLSSKSQIQNKLAYFSADAAASALAEDRLPQPRSASQMAAPALPTVVGSQSGVVAWLDATLARAVAEGASDVHFSFRADKSLNLRFRIDGMIRTVQVPIPVERGLEIIGALLSKSDSMDSSNYREPQDGTFSFEAAGRQIDARVGMLPQINGPYVVVRLLDSLNVRTRLDDMGFSSEALEVMRRHTASSAGTVLVSGPTGSGKSTSLYGLIREVDAVTKNVITVEDPVEYKLPDINQTAIRSDIGDKSLTFPRALRSILRLDPDIILVGEIRDVDTARVAMDAAITGHLVLSTVHAPSAIGVYTRLIEMGVPPYMVAEALSLTISQRLLRRVHECARIEAPTREEIVWFAEQGLTAPDRVAHAVGCLACSGGYRGRLATVEYLEPTRRFRTLVAARATYEELEAEALASAGFRPIINDGVRHIHDLRTSVSEVIRVLAAGEDR